MNKEEFIDTLQACYFGDRGAFNKILKEYEELHNKIDKAIEYLINPPKKIWEGHSIDEVLEILDKVNKENVNERKRI